MTRSLQLLDENLGNIINFFYGDEFEVLNYLFKNL